MSEFMTTKDLTKNEVTMAVVIAGVLVLAAIVVFFNSAHMDQKDLPVIAFTALPSQTADGSGLVTFGADISKLSFYDNKLKVEYSLDGENYLPLVLAQAVIDNGSLKLANGADYQISEINSDNDTANLNFTWDTKTAPPNISSDQVKIKITLAYKLKSTVPEVNTNENTDLTPNDNSEPEVIINTNEATIEDDVIIESEQIQPDQPTGDLPPEQDQSAADPDAVDSQADSPVTILSPNSGTLNTRFMGVIKEVFSAIKPIQIANASPDNWSEIAVISDNFRLDNTNPEVVTGQVDLATGQIYINFNEAMNTDLSLTNEPIKLQNDILAESTLSWFSSQILVISLSAAEKLKYTAPLGDWIFQIDAVNNFQDLAGNKFAGGLIALTEQKDEVMPPEINPEDKPKEDEIKKDEPVIAPPKVSQLISTRGYNQSCSFEPEDLIMAAGETRQVALNLVPREVDSIFSLTASSRADGFIVKISEATGTGTGPVNVDVTAPSQAAPRLYKILIKYQDILPQAVGYVNNCVLRLTVQ